MWRFYFRFSSVWLSLLRNKLLANCLRNRSNETLSFTVLLKSCKPDFRTIKKATNHWFVAFCPFADHFCPVRSAEREGFEPPVPLSTTVFKTVVIDHSTISPILCPGNSLPQKRCKGTWLFSFVQIFNEKSALNFWFYSFPAFIALCKLLLLNDI